MTTAREVLFSSEPICFLEMEHRHACMFGGKISHGDDVLVIWMNRCVFPVGIADLMNLDGQFEICHTDCFKNYSNGSSEKGEENVSTEHKVTKVVSEKKE